MTEEKLERKSGLRRYLVNYFFNEGKENQKYYRAKNKSELKKQIIDEGNLGRLKEILVYIKSYENRKQLRTTFYKYKKKNNNPLH